MSSPCGAVIGRALLAVACGLILACSATARAGDAPHEKLSRLAPADRYFGRMKISFIGIDNAFAQADRTVTDDTTDSGIAHKLDFAMEALNDWRNAYPHDPQLARAYFLGARALKKIWIKAYQDKAWSYMNVIRSDYRGTYFAKLVDADLARGFTENYFAAPAICDPNSTPQPSAPTSEPSPLATNGGKYRVLVHPAPCVAATPAPAATASGSALPEPTVSPSPTLRPTS